MTKIVRWTAIILALISFPLISSAQDSDGDGVADSIEISLGSNPLDAKVVPSVVKLIPERKVTDVSSTQQRPRLAWTGSELGFTWYDDRHLPSGNYEIYFKRLDTAGNSLLADTRITSNAQVSYFSDLAWSGSEYGLAWADMRDGNREIYLTILNGAGTKTLTDLRITSNTSYSMYPEIAWNGQRFGLLWSDNYYSNYDLFFVATAADGNTVAVNKRITLLANDQTAPSLVAAGSDFAFCWTDTRAGNEIYLKRIDQDGNDVGSNVRITSNAADSKECSLAWTGSEYGLAWSDYRDSNYEIYFQRVAADGTLQGGNLRITSAAQASEAPRLIWQGSVYGLTWRDERDGNREIYFNLLTAGGQRRSPDFRVTQTAEISMSSDVMWADSAFNLTLADYRTTKSEIYFTRLGFDHDGDGLSDLSEAGYATDPADWDTDGDLLPDGWEIQYAACGLDPLVADSVSDPDADTLSQLQEYLIGTNPCSNDSDSDGMDDGWEAANACLNPIVNDAAGDADADALSNLGEDTAGTNPCAADTDGDGMPDGYEIQNNLNPLNEGDKIFDPDADGLTNWEEYYYGTDPRDADSDNDGLTDRDELLLTLTNPQDADSDDDGMPDGWEYQHDLDPLLDDTGQDPDADGLTNLEEYFFLLDPQSYDLDSDRDGLANAVETGTGVYQNLGDTGTEELDPDTDGGREWDGLEVLVNHDPHSSADDRTWSAGARIAAGDIYFSDFILAQTADNVLHAVWQQPDTVGGDHLNRTYYSQLQGGTWTAPQLVFANTVEGLDTLAQGNTLHLVYRRSPQFPLTESLQYRTRSSAGVWSGPTTVSSALDNNSELDLALLPNGNLYAFYGIWYGNTDAVAYSIRNTATGVWTSTDLEFPHNLANIQGGCFHVKADLKGNLHLAYEDRSISPSDVFYSKLAYGATVWTAPLNVSAMPWEPSLFPRLTVDREGTVHFLWSQYNPSEHSNYYRRLKDGVLSPPVAVNPYTAGTQWNDIATDALDNVYIVTDYLFTGLAHFGMLGEIRYSPSYLSRGFQLLPDRDGKKLHLLYYKSNGIYNIEYYSTALDFPDTDTDGLNDLQEFLMGSNPNDADTDNDALSDYNELAVYLSDPNDPDSDRDGLKDGEEVGLAHSFSCAATSCAASGCTYLTSNGHHYLFCNTLQTWQNARAICLSYDGDLASIDSAAEKAWIRPNLTSLTWIGLNDQTTESNFIWGNGAAKLYTNWGPGEPNDSGGNEDCTEMLNGNGEWNDDNCAITRPFLCEDGVHPSPIIYDTDQGGESDGLEHYLGKDPDDPADDYAHGPVQLVDGVTTYFNSTQLTLDQTGKINLFYDLETYISPNHVFEVRAVASTDGGSSWSSRNVIYSYSNPTDSSWYYLQDAQVLGSDTTVMIILHTNTGLKSALYSHGTLGAWTTIAATGPRQDLILTTAKLTVFNSDKALLVWTTAAATNASYQLWSSLWDRSTGWSTPVSIATGNSSFSCLFFNPFLAPDGSAHLAYSSLYDPSGQDRSFLYYRRWTGSSWTAEETLNTANNAYTWYPSLWVSAGDVRHVLFNLRPYAESKSQLWYLKSNGSTWEAPVQLAADQYEDYSWGLQSFNLAESQNEVVHTFALGAIDGQFNTVRISRFNRFWTDPIPFLPYPYQVGDFAVGANKVIHMAGRKNTELFYTNYSYPDTDSDGITDDGEFYSGTNRALADSDGDGLTDYQELVTYNSNPTLSDTDDDGLTDPQEISAGTNPNLRDSDGDYMPDAWEIAAGLDPNLANGAADPDADGFTNLQEFRANLNPIVAEAIPSSVASSPAYNHADTIPVTFACSTPLASVDLYLSFNSLPFINMAPFGYTKPCYNSSLSFAFTTLFGDGTYRFSTRATLTSLRVEAAPASPDTITIQDTQKPAMQSVTDEGGYSSQTNRIAAIGAAADLGPAGIDGYWYAIGTAAYPAAGWNSVVTGQWDADGTVNHLFGATVLNQGAQYYLSMMAQDLAGNTSPPLSSNGIRIDTSPPTAVTVSDDGAYTGFPDRLHAVWTGGNDATSGLDHYECAIGTAPGLTDVVGWTGVGTLTAMTRYGLALSETQSYFVGVKAVNGAGLTAIGWSDGTMVDSEAPVLAYSSPAHREISNDVMPPVYNLPVALNLDDGGGSGVDWDSLAVVLDFSTVTAFTHLAGSDTVSFAWGDSLALGNHIVSLRADDAAGNRLNQNVIFVLEDPRKVFINPVSAQWRPGDPALSFTADGGTGGYHWVATGGVLDSTTAATVRLTPTAAPGAYVVAVSDRKLISAQASVVVRGEVDVAPNVARINPGDSIAFTASGGSGSFTWTVTGGSCALSGTRNEVCLFTASLFEGDFLVRATDAAAHGFSSRLIVTGSVGRAIIAVGGGLVDANRQVEALNQMGHFAYETLLSRGFSPDQIYYLNPDPYQSYDGDGDGYLDDIDCAPGATIGCAPSRDHLRYAVKTWAVADLGPDNPGIGPGAPLIIYLVDHGGADSFLINYTSPSTPETLPAASVDEWLDEVQGGATVALIYDACYSGSFLGEVGAGGTGRLVVSSAGFNESAYFGVNGTVSFSQFFWQHVRQGFALGDAFDQARLALASWSGQHPQLDDNGTGAYETEGGAKDGAAAAVFTIGADFVTGALAPELAPMADTVVDPEATLTLWTEVWNVQTYEVATVFGLLSPPGYLPPRSAGDYATPGFDDAEGLPLPRFYLESNSGSGRWEHALTPAEIAALFPTNGRYTLTLYAQDRGGNVSAQAEVVLTIFGPDAYEVDDDWSSANPIEVDALHYQAHNSHDAFDQDWVKFEIVSPGLTRIQTLNLAENCDTVIQLYGPYPGGTAGPGPELARDDDSGGNLASMLYLDLSPGVYYVRVSQYDGGTVFGEGTDYDLDVNQLWVPVGTLEGYVTDAVTGYGVYGAVVKVGLGGTNYVSTTTIEGGYYEFLNVLPAGSGYSFTVTKANFNIFAGTCPQIISGARARKDAALAAKAGTGLLTGIVRDGAAPLGGARVVINFAQLKTDVAGRYSIRLSAGTYSVDARADGYQNYLAAGLAVTANNTTVHDVAMITLDTDGDGVPDGLETGCLNPNSPDTDGDGLTDGTEDADHDGIQDPTETDPCVADTDHDGVPDGQETGGLNPLNWDTDADRLPDGFERDHSSGQPGDNNLNPLAPADGAADFDGDDNSNKNEYWNGSDPWNADPTPGQFENPACYYWADSDGDGTPAPSDLVMLRLEIAGVPQSYLNILPHSLDTLDLDRDGNAAPSDQILLKLIVALAERPGGYPSQAGSLEVISAPTGSVAVGSTTHVTVSVHSMSGGIPYAPGFGVVFTISSGNAVLLGGDGTAVGQPAGNRYDFSMAASAGARANMVVLVTGPGPITINVKVPSCGISPNGRWCAEVLATPIAINTP
jgi:hypothetical protein